jgi:ABC-type nickel/cobalt efflux system permease component RcnA
MPAIEQRGSANKKTQNQQQQQQQQYQSQNHQQQDDKQQQHGGGKQQAVNQQQQRGAGSKHADGSDKAYEGEICCTALYFGLVVVSAARVVVILMVNCMLSVSCVELSHLF